jgi:hypothetical protein
MQSSRRLSLLPTVALAALVVPAPAGAATQIGEVFPPESICGPMTPMNPPVTFLQTTSPGNQYAAPFEGVITSWSFLASASPPDLKLKIARPTGGNNYTTIGESTFRIPDAQELNTYTDVQIPVEGGDVIGFTVRANGDCGRTGPMMAAGYGTSNLDQDVPPGEEAEYTPVPLIQESVAAGLEPDCDSDGAGDETQDASVASCHPRALTLDANKNKVKKGKRVRLSGQLSEIGQGGSCVANQPVELQRKKPSKTEFTTVEQLQTNAAGGFSTKEKVKKTFEYRVQALETATCGAADSNTEKVKAKKPK